MAAWLAAAYFDMPPRDEARALVAEIHRELPRVVRRRSSRASPPAPAMRAPAPPPSRPSRPARVLQARLRILMASVVAVFAAGVAAVLWLSIARPRLGRSGAPLPPVWGPADGYALFVRGLGGPQAILLGLLLLRGSLPAEGVVALAVDLPVFWWVASYLKSRESSATEAFGLAPSPRAGGPRSPRRPSC